MTDRDAQFIGMIRTDNISEIDSAVALSVEATIDPDFVRDFAQRPRSGGVRPGPHRLPLHRSRCLARRRPRRRPHGAPAHAGGAPAGVPGADGRRPRRGDARSFQPAAGSRSTSSPAAATASWRATATGPRRTTATGAPTSSSTSCGPCGPAPSRSTTRASSTR